MRIQPFEVKIWRKVLTLAGLLVTGLLVSISCSLPGLARETPSAELQPTLFTSVTTTLVVVPTFTYTPTMIVPQLKPSSTPVMLQTPLTTPLVPPLPSPTLTPRGKPAADASLISGGPWLLLSSNMGLWIANPDGSGFKPLTRQAPLQPANFAHAVGQGGWIAYITAENKDLMRGVNLNLVALPFGKPSKTILLAPPDREPRASSKPGDAVVEAMRAVLDLESFAWSPDGVSIAFMGMIDGPTSDLYVYSLKTDKISRLTEGPSQGISPSWSPDQAYVAHFGVNSLGTGAGFAMAGAWAARASDANVTTLYTIPKGSSGEEVAGWLSAKQVLVHSWNAACGSKDLRAYTIGNQVPVSIWPDCFDDLAFDPVSGTGVLGISSDVAQANGNARQGVWLFSGAQRPRQIQELFVRPVWSEEAGVFFGHAGKTLYTFSLDGAVQQYPLPLAADPLVSPGAKYWAIPAGFISGSQMGQNGLWVGPAGQTLNRVYSSPVQQVIWRPDGTGLFFISGKQIYTAYAPDFSPILIGDDFEFSGTSNFAWVTP